MRRQNYGNGVSAGDRCVAEKLGQKNVSPQSITLLSGTLLAQKFCALNQNPRDMRQLEVFEIGRLQESSNLRFGSYLIVFR